MKSKIKLYEFSSASYGDQWFVNATSKQEAVGLVKEYERTKGFYSLGVYSNNHSVIDDSEEKYRTGKLNRLLEQIDEYAENKDGVGVILEHELGTVIATEIC